MNKEKYELSELEIIRFQTEDVILASYQLEEDEIPLNGRGSVL